MLPEYPLKITDWYNIPIGNVEKLMTNIFDKKIYVHHYENLKLHLRPGLKLKKLHHVLKLNQPQWLKLYTELKKRIKAEKMETKMEKRCTN